MMDDILKQALLYDFYGELLTTHQKDIYEQFVLEDLSLGEIAGNTGISRQAVHDLIKRCNKTLQGYENRLHLVSRFLTIKKKLHDINEILDRDTEPGADTMELKADIRRIADEIIEEL